MNPYLTVAAILAAAVAVAHSYLGERYIIMRLLRRPELPRLFGDDTFTRYTLRFAWHLTTVAWLGFGALLAAMATPGRADIRSTLLGVVAATFFTSFVVTAVGSRGRHLAWIVFLAIAGATWLAM